MVYEYGVCMVCMRIMYVYEYDEWYGVWYMRHCMVYGYGIVSIWCMVQYCMVYGYVWVCMGMYDGIWYGILMVYGMVQYSIYMVYDVWYDVWYGMVWYSIVSMGVWYVWYLYNVWLMYYRMIT